jgi:transcriptional regulator with XRE-family HTH domain
MSIEREVENMADENINRIFSNNLRKWLSIRHKTQADMYKKMGVSSASAADWCTGIKIPRVDKIVELADWLMIELSDLLEDGDRTPSDMDRLIYRLKDDRYFYELVRDINGFDDNLFQKVIDYVELLKK